MRRNSGGGILGPHGPSGRNSPKQNHQQMSLTFMQDDVYKMSYDENEEPACPMGLVVESSIVVAKGSVVYFRSLVDNLTIPMEAFYQSHSREQREQQRLFNEYKAGLARFIEYRNGLIAKGHRDLRKS
jgi:hypothetical protein